MKLEWGQADLRSGNRHHRRPRLEKREYDPSPCPCECARDRQIVIVVWVHLSLGIRAAILSLDPGGQVTILGELALEQL